MSGRSVAKRATEDQQLSSIKRPKLPLSLYRQQQLTEEDYVEAIENIIKRDFFPDLYAADQQAKAQRKQEAKFNRVHAFNEYDRTERSGWASARSARPQDTPATFRNLGATPAMGRELGSETPVTPIASTSRLPAPEEELKPYDESLSLTDFLSTYTSEDNASFAEILDRNNEARRLKYSWAYETEQKANERENRARENRQNLIECVRRAVEQSATGEVSLIEGAEPGRPGERLVLEYGKTSVLGDRDSVKLAKQRVIAGPSNAFMIEAAKEGESAASTVEKGKGKEVARVEGTEEAAEELEVANIPLDGKDVDRVETWPYTARNNFMFAPDANVALKDVRPKAIDNKEAGMVLPKGINHLNTRLPGTASDLSPDLIPPSPSRSNIAAAIGGTPYPGRGSETPRVNGYGFVDAMPSLLPTHLGSTGLKQLMTYGTLSATPVALRSLDSDEPAPVRNTEVKEGPFKIPATPRREELALKMAKNASKSLGARHGVNVPTLSSAMATSKRLGLTPGRVDSPFGQTGKSVTPRTRSEGLTPAGKSLLSRTGSVAREREKAVQAKLKETKW